LLLLLWRAAGANHQGQILHHGAGRGAGAVQVQPQPGAHHLLHQLPLRQGSAFTTLFIITKQTFIHDLY